MNYQTKMFCMALACCAVAGLIVWGLISFRPCQVIEDTFRAPEPVCGKVELWVQEAHDAEFSMHSAAFWVVDQDGKMVEPRRQIKPIPRKFDRWDAIYLCGYMDMDLLNQGTLKGWKAMFEFYVGEQVYKSIVDLSRQRNPSSLQRKEVMK